MSTLIRLVFWRKGGLGLWLATLGLRGQGSVLRSTRGATPGGSQRLSHSRINCCCAVRWRWSRFAFTLVVSSWPIAALTAACGAWYAPTAFRQRGAHQREMAVVEAIATWTEQIRDTLAAANGLEQRCQCDVGARAERHRRAQSNAWLRELGTSGCPTRSRRLADDINHPMADFVVAALVIAAEKEARDLGALLTHLSESARGEAQMRSRVWVGRARSRSAVRIIVSVVVAFILGLLLFNRAYLQPYDSASGQLVLGVVLAIFASAFVMMQRMGAIAMPERFIGRRQAEVVV